MSKRIKNILASLLVATALTTSFTSCGSSKSENTTEQSQTQQQTNSDRDTGGRKPQVNIGNQTTDDTATESIYKDGEVVTLADGSKIKYNANGDHELLEQGDGIVIIFKNVTEEQLSSLDGDKRAMVERQMQSDPNGFALIY